jgi:hypothetical protein
MLSSQTNESGQKAAAAEKHRVTPLTISLPKGGGAIRGIGEKFAANPVTGTGSMTVPIATSPGRAGFGPQLSLAYDSGASNGLFGLGWGLALPAITRKTDKGLRQYRDAEESDVFMLSGWESSDDKGNVITYQYKPENADGVDRSQAHERNRTPHFLDLTSDRSALRTREWRSRWSLITPTRGQS